MLLRILLECFTVFCNHFTVVFLVPFSRLVYVKDANWIGHDHDIHTYPTSALALRRQRVVIAWNTNIPVNDAECTAIHPADFCSGPWSFPTVRRGKQGLVDAAIGTNLSSTVRYYSGQPIEAIFADKRTTPAIGR
jgi:hypothetical protein